MMDQTGEKKRSVRLRFKNPKYDKIIRLNTESIARKMGFSEDQVFDITLAVEEAYTNAVEHSGRNLEDLEIEILYQLFADRLEITIQDTGCGFDEKIKEAADVSLVNNQSARGRGLGLIKSLADKSEILSAPGVGTLVRIVKFLNNHV